MDFKLELVLIPVSDVDRAKAFYQGLGWRIDADFVTGPDFRVVQMTPPGSACAVIFGTGLTTSAPGSADGLQLVTEDIEAARADLAARRGVRLLAPSQTRKHDPDPARSRRLSRVRWIIERPPHTGSACCRAVRRCAPG